MAERPTACSAWQDDLAGWLVGQIDPVREARLDAHVAGCAACAAERASLLAVVAVSLAADPDGPEEDADPLLVGADAPPPAGVDLPSSGLPARIEAAVGRERRALRRRQLVVGVVVGVVGAAAVAMAAGAVRDDAPAPLRGEAVAFSVVPRGASARAVVGHDGSGTVVEVRAAGMDPGVTFAVWLTPPGGGWGDRVAAGTFRPDADGQVDVRLRSALPADEVGRLWVTTPDGDIALDTQPPSGRGRQP